jgi:hypothetical protein
LRRLPAQLGRCLTTGRLKTLSASAREAAKSLSYESFKIKLSEVINFLSSSFTS